MTIEAVAGQQRSGMPDVARWTAPEPPDSMALMLTHAASGVWRHKSVLIGCLIVVPAISWAILQQMTPLFTADATVIYEPQSYNQQELQSILQPDTTTEEVVTTQVQVIQGLHSAERIVDRFDLEKNPEFNAALRPTPSLIVFFDWLRDSTRNLAASLVNPVSHRAAVRLSAKPSPPPDQAEIRRSVVAAVQAAIDAKAVRQSHIIDVSFTSRSRVLAADVANELANLYISDQLQLKFDAVQSANKWLEGQADELRREVQEKENRITSYRASRGLTLGVSAGLVTEEVSQLSSNLNEAQNELAQAEGLVSAAHGRLGSSAQAAVSPSVVALRAQRDALSAQLQSLLAHLGPNHPTVIAMREQLNVLSHEVNGETGQVMAASDAAVRAARAKVAGLDQQLRAARERVANAAQEEIPLDAMQREADASTTLLQTVLDSIQRLAQQAAIETSDARLVSAALPPSSPSSPKTAILLPASALLGLFVGFLLIYLIEQNQSRFRHGHDVRSILGLNCLAKIPQIDPVREGVAGMADYLVKKPFSLAAEQVRALRAALWLGADRPKVVAIAAARPGEGKTTTSICLGRSAGLSGERIVVVECDTRKPGFTKLMGVPETAGLLDFLGGNSPLEDVIHRDPLGSFDFIPAGISGRSNSHTLFMSQQMVMLLNRLRRDYDLVVLDLPPVIALADARIVASLADATLLCVRWQTTPRKVAVHCYEMLQHAGANVVGAALTRVDIRTHAKSGHADAESYHARYASYYQ